MVRPDRCRCSSKENIRGSPTSTWFTRAMVPDAAHAVLTVDLGAIAANWRLLYAKQRCGAVVKGDGYGLGARQVAAALAAVGCGDFFVATPDEALSLRDTIPD